MAKRKDMERFLLHGYLELALNKAKLASLCGIELKSTIKVVFHDGEKEPATLDSWF